MIAHAYANGVPMGGDLMPSSSAAKPSFLAYAVKDPDGQKLRAIELIKGWIGDNGEMKAEVIPVASNENGADSLCQVYVDKTFEPSQSAYYYLRAVEPATARWHTYDCDSLDKGQRPPVCNDGSYPETIVEMAWTSPIWYQGKD